MTSRKLVAKTIKGENPGRTPIYGWVFANLEQQLTERFGSVENFEDHYEFDMSHVFGGPWAWDGTALAKMREKGEEVTPEAVLDIPMPDTENMEDYKGVIDALEHHQKQRGRFCYIQSEGIFESVNGVFGIEDHLCNMALYPDEMAELYKRLAERNKKVAANMIELGIDMIHVSDDWGAQRGLIFSMDMWKEFIYPNHKSTNDFIKSKGVFVSLHSDGNVVPALDGIVDLGYDVVHPWQETAGMTYDIYLDKYQDKFGILGGLCIQSTLGFNDYKKLESEIRRVFELLKGKRWMFCTTHFVQDHCSIDELVYAYDLAVKLGRN